MEPTQQPTATVSSPVSRGLFGTKVPSSVAFILGILLFLMPFAEIKCGGSTIANKSGIDFALGNEWKTSGNAGMFGKKDFKDNSMSASKQEKGNTQIFAIAALALGILGLLLSFANAKAGGTGGLLTGILSAGALIGLIFAIKDAFNKAMAADQAIKKAQDNTNDFGLSKMGDSISNMILNFTPWVYVAIVAFLAAAFFCYKRMSVRK